MRRQPDLFDWMEPPSVPSPTSEAAARDIAESAPALRRKVYHAIRDAPDGLTREEIEDVLNLGGNTVRPRVWELLKEGMIVESADVRKTRSGRLAYVLRAK